MLREQGVYHCTDATRLGLALSNEEAARLRAIASARGLAAKIHPRTFLLDGRRRAAVVLDWHMPHKACPFYESYRCTVYDARPLVCRAYPVLTLGRGGLAPECPKMPVAKSALRTESAARGAIERAHAKLDETGLAILERGRFTLGLTSQAAHARLRAYRIMTPEEFLSRAPATRSTN